MNCAQELESLVAASCASPVIAGTYGKAYLIPFDAIDKGNMMVSGNVIATILLKNGQKAHTFESFDSSTVGATSLVAGTYVNTMQHDLTLRVFIRSEEAKAFVNALLNARVVAIIKNKEAGDPDQEPGAAQYEAYGWESGLKLTGITADTTVADGVVYELALGSDETSKEKSLPKSVWAGGMDETEQMLESLVTP